MSKFEKIETRNIPEKQLTPSEEKEIEEFNHKVNFI